jgi:Asp-tRNA(Asn)/Glu-tRNA(Gln) amidotransferase A subunit family amidase
MADLLTRPLAQLARCLARKEASPVDLMREALQRIDADRDLNAFVALRLEGDLLQEARAAEERIGRGEGRPLEGVPLGVKDLEDVAGMVTSHGSKVFRDNVAQRDSIQVERLRAAGAIVVGKTNAPEFGATAITKNPLFGVTRNPWNPERTPGGSSGGSSAAIAAGLVPLVTASDGGGSIRIPASFTGCFGLKTSYGRVPHGPMRYWITDDTAVYGPLTRSVEDAALFLDVVAGPHPLDPNSLPHPGLSYREVLRDLPRPLRIAFSPELGHAVVQSDVASVVASAVRAFEEIGSAVETIEGGPPELGYDWGVVGAFHLLGELEPYLPERGEEFGRGFLSGVKVGARMTPRLWAESRLRREELNRWCAALFDEYDLLVTPTVPYDPPPARGPFPETLEGRKLSVVSVASFTIPFNLSWHPAASVRAGFSKANLPVGMQIVGPRHRDDLVLQAAFAFEQARPWTDRWPDRAPA